MNDVESKYLKAVEKYFDSKPTPNEKDLEQIMQLYLKLPDYETLSGQFKRLKGILLNRLTFNSEYESFQILEGDPDHIKWLNDRKGIINWAYWNRYEQFLLDEQGFPARSVYKIDELTDEILNRTGDPASGRPFDIRGMVVGNVQSGKTANFVGLINKAFDAGYKLVIVLAGIHNSLRSQTQLRIDAGVRGRDSKISRIMTGDSNHIGVGMIDRRVTVHSLTSSEGIGDFDRNSYLSNNTELGGNDPVIAVIKKNIHVLRNLIQWLRRNGVKTLEGNTVIRNLPVLIIDDEADNASINTKRRQEDISRTNILIREMLNVFEQKTFIGYTATPFANIFIPNLDTDDVEYDRAGQDLFPKDFIVTIPPPPQYVGALQFFGLDPDLGYEEAADLPTLHETAIVQVRDHKNAFPPKHKKNDSPPREVEDLPKSLAHAVKSFILTCAIRSVRGHGNKHNSMLVHVSYFVRWQRQVTELIKELIGRYRRFIRANEGGLREELRELYETTYIPASHHVRENFETYSGASYPINEWTEIEASLVPSTEKIRVMEIHGEAVEALDYEDHKQGGISVIAVGGNKLSRGLTLEGLSVSYFLRSSRNYDTLLQMGRWFGYRPGYLDLCRLYTTPQLIDWFGFITMANAELWNDLRYLHLTGARPIDFGLKVRRHSSGLQITAGNKQVETHQIEINFSNRLRETHKLFTDRQKVHQNLNVLRTLLADISPGNRVRLSPPDRDGRKFTHHICWQNVPVDPVCRFLTSFQSPNDMGFSGEELSQYITELNRKDELTKWTVILINIGGTAKKVDLNEVNEEVGMVKRSHDKSLSDGKTYRIRKAHIISKDHEWLDLTSDQYQHALRYTQEAWEGGSQKKNKPEYPSGHFLRKVRPANKGLLLLYILDPEGYPETESASKIPADTPVTGYAVSFPESQHAEAAIYRVRTDFIESLAKVDDDEE